MKELIRFCICSHLDNLAVFSSNDLLDKWYVTCFAGVINESSLVRVWDKICGGSKKIVVFIFLELAKALSDKALKCNTRQEFKTLVEQVSFIFNFLLQEKLIHWIKKNKTKENF